MKTYKLNQLPKLFLVALCSLAIITNASTDQTIINHKLNVSYEPVTHKVKVTNIITLDKEVEGNEIEFKLHSNLKISTLTPGTSIKAIEADVRGIDKGMDQQKFDNAAPVPLTAYILTFGKSYKGKRDQFSISYEGIINHQL
ncbi:MAG: hypothetical protein COA74_01775 [Gammaproteobacteria bacterium]|nr:MAG: hypothetical protein COA74_01775 [Gammaproteobacteria bacterium]